MFNELVIVRGGGDIASGTIQKLHRSGFKVLILEVSTPTSIRRTVCFSEAIYEGQITIEGVTSVYACNVKDVRRAWLENKIPVVVDPNGLYIDVFKPQIVIDAILAKKNLGTTMDMADITIALGPGFEAGKDVHAVVETMRGHNLGRVILEGYAKKNTGVPGNIMGYSKERVIYSPCAGVIRSVRNIGDIVEASDIIAYVDDTEVKASINGLLRGIIRNGSNVDAKFKIADIDPRITEKENCYTISDKARSIGGGVLEAILYLKNNKNYGVCGYGRKDIKRSI